MTVKQSSSAVPPDLETNTGYQLWLAANSLQRAYRKGLIPLRLTFVQHFALTAASRLAADNDGCSQAQVCRFCGMDQQYDGSALT